MTESPYIKAVRAEITRLYARNYREVGPIFLRKQEAGLARFNGRYRLTLGRVRPQILHAIHARLGANDEWPDGVTSIYVTKQGRNDPILMEGDRAASAR